MLYTSSSLSAICDTGAYGPKYHMRLATTSVNDLTILILSATLGMICKVTANLKCPLSSRPILSLYPFPTKCTNFGAFPNTDDAT